MKKKKRFYAEVTDLFCNELNYSYIRRYNIHAVSMRGAIGKLSRHYGLHFRMYLDDGDGAIYHSTTKLTGVYMELSEVSSIYFVEEL